MTDKTISAGWAVDPSEGGVVISHKSRLYTNGLNQLVLEYDEVVALQAIFKRLNQERANGVVRPEYVKARSEAIDAFSASIGLAHDEIIKHLPEDVLLYRFENGE